MLTQAEVFPAAVTVAHPVSGDPHVDIPLALTSGVAALLVFAVALTLPARQRRVERPEPPLTSWAGALSAGQVAVRVGAVFLLALAIAAGRFGVDDQLDNLAPALVVGVAWPLLVLASVTIGPVWRWLDPWDGLSRAFIRDERGQPPDHVWPAVVVAVPIVWYLSAYPDPLDPRSVGTALALYTVLTVSGCVAVGRVRWLAASEPLGIVLSWMALVPRGRLVDWRPPRGAEALLGVLAGGILFGSVRRTELWSGVSVLPGQPAHATLGLAAFCLAYAAFFIAMGRVAQRLGGRPGIARAVVPAVAGIMIAVALARNRLFTSLQLLPGLLGDPFGQGWNLVGPTGRGLDPAPLGATWLLVLQLAVLLAAHLLGAFVATRRLRGGARLPAAIVLLYMMAGSVAATAMH